MKIGDQIYEPFVIEVPELLRVLKTTEEGLSDAEVLNRRKEYGFNELPDTFRTPRWQILINQFKGPIVLLLVVAAGISFYFGDIAESIAIVAVILLNGSIGYILESQAVHSMQALRKIDKSYSQVRRSGKVVKRESREIVPGDIVLLEAGDLIPADGRIIESKRFEVNEASLTGESVPVEKQSRVLNQPGTALGDRINMVYKGTAVTRGNAVFVATDTALHTEIGKISNMVESAQKDEIPLNEKLNDFGKKLIWITLGLIVAFLIVGLIRNKDAYIIVETAIALAVAAIPEGLPIVATISLARGMIQLSKKNVIIKKLAAVETLGETDVIITDKTGTLTENRLKVVEIETAEGMSPADLIYPAILCNNAKEDKGEFFGDPVEVALLEYFLGNHQEDARRIQDEWKEVDELPFDSDVRYMANLYERSGEFISVVKGSPNEVLDLCRHPDKNKWVEHTSRLAAGGLKVLGFAMRRYTSQPSDYTSELDFAGLIGFLDPPRDDIEQSVQECKSAGIRIIMATGDHPETAQAIAEQIGIGTGNSAVKGNLLEGISDSEKASLIESTDIFSRVTPSQKLEIVNYHQSRGHIVGMTGDGVNDAPALKKSDIGIAMGKRGTQVAEEAADMVLQDDSFISIVHAIRHGRIIFGNIRNFIIYLLSCNLTELMVVSIAAFMNTVLPLLPLQILFLNLVTDVFPALALGMGKGHVNIMNKKRRDPSAPILNRSNWRAIIIYAFVMTISILGAYSFSHFILNHSDQETNTIAFLSLSLAQLTHPFNLTTGNEKFFGGPIFRNKFLWYAILLCLTLLAAALFVPFLRETLSLVVPNASDWLIILTASILPVGIIRIIKINGHGKG